MFLRALFWKETAELTINCVPLKCDIVARNLLNESTWEIARQGAAVRPRLEAPVVGHEPRHRLARQIRLPEGRLPVRARGCERATSWFGGRTIGLDGGLHVRGRHTPSGMFRNTGWIGCRLGVGGSGPEHSLRVRLLASPTPIPTEACESRADE